MRQLELIPLSGSQYKYAVHDLDSKDLLGHISTYSEPSDLIHYSFVPLAGHAIAVSTSMLLVLEIYIGDDVQCVIKEGK